MTREPPSAFRRAAALLVRIVCYGALAALVASLVAITLFSASGACPQLDDAAVVCASTAVQVVAETALSVVLVTVFTGFPLILPIVGLVLLVSDIRRWRRA